MNCFGFFHYILVFFTVLDVHPHIGHLVTTVLTHSTFLYGTI